MELIDVNGYLYGKMTKNSANTTSGLHCEDKLMLFLMVHLVNTLAKKFKNKHNLLTSKFFCLLSSEVNRNNIRRNAAILQKNPVFVRSLVNHPSVVLEGEKYRES
jgi:hypothetical protein